MFRNTKLERCAKKCEARGGRLPPKGAAYPCEAAEDGGQTTAGGGAATGYGRKGGGEKRKSSQKLAKKLNLKDGRGKGGKADSGGGGGGGGGGRRLSKSSTRTCSAAGSSSLVRRKPLLPGQVATPSRHSSDAGDAAPPLWIEFLEVLLVQRRKSYWRHYYDDQVKWVTSSIQDSLGLDALTASLNVVEIGTFTVTLDCRRYYRTRTLTLASRLPNVYTCHDSTLYFRYRVGRQRRGHRARIPRRVSVRGRPLAH